MHQRGESDAARFLRLHSNSSFVDSPRGRRGDEWRKMTRRLWNVWNIHTTPPSSLVDIHPYLFHRCRSYDGPKGRDLSTGRSRCPLISPFSSTLTRCVPSLELLCVRKHVCDEVRRYSQGPSKTDASEQARVTPSYFLGHRVA